MECGDSVRPIIKASGSTLDRDSNMGRGRRYPNSLTVSDRLRGRKALQEEERAKNHMSLASHFHVLISTEMPVSGRSIFRLLGLDDVSITTVNGPKNIWVAYPRTLPRGSRKLYKWVSRPNRNVRRSETPPSEATQSSRQSTLAAGDAARAPSPSTEPTVESSSGSPQPPPVSGPTTGEAAGTSSEGGFAGQCEGGVFKASQSASQGFEAIVRRVVEECDSSDAAMKKCQKSRAACHSLP